MAGNTVHHPSPYHPTQVNAISKASGVRRLRLQDPGNTHVQDLEDFSMMPGGVEKRASSYT